MRMRFARELMLDAEVEDGPEVRATVTHAKRLWSAGFQHAQRVCAAKASPGARTENPSK